VSTVTYLVGDVFDQLATLEPDSVDLVLTSPPFLALRSYLPADHPDKGREIGSEPTPAAFVDTLLDVVEALDRVLAPHGSLVIELGDTYSGAGGYGDPDSPNPAYGNGDRFTERWNGRTTKRFKTKDNGWPLAKSLALVPESFRWALAYGRNPFNGRATAPWRVRNVVRWCRPNPPVGALGDKFRPATTDLVVACHSAQRYFDLDAVRTARPELVITNGGNMDPRNQRGDDWRRGQKPEGGGVSNPAGAPPLDWWEIPTEPYPGAHYATWPQALCVVPIKAMCPERVCVVCGQPSRRVMEVDGLRGRDFFVTAGGENDRGLGLHGRRSPMPTITRQTVDWTDCGCEPEPGSSRPDAVSSTGYQGNTPGSRWRPGTVLDPFAGSGTTLAVAHGHGRSAIGIDLDSRNRDLALERVGMWLAEPPRPVQDVQLELVME